MISVWPGFHSLSEALVSLPVQFVVVTIVPHSKAIFKFRVIIISKCEENKGFKNNKHQVSFTFIHSEDNCQGNGRYKLDGKTEFDRF